MKQTAKRHVGIELLRLLSMTMVVTLHALSNSSLLSDTTGLRHEFVWLVEILCYCAVDCFVLIGGYVNRSERFRLSNVVLLWMQVVFYLLIFTVFAPMAKGTMPDGLTVVKCFFPFCTWTYWYYTCYFPVMLFSPLLNRAVNRLNHRESLFVLGTLFVLCSLLPQILVPLKLWKENLFYFQRGYSPHWLGVVYLMGMLLRRMEECNPPRRRHPLAAALVYLLCCGITFGIWHSLAPQPKLQMIHISYCGPLVLMAAAALFLTFLAYQPGDGLVYRGILWLSQGTFAVYLMHCHGWFRRFVQWLFDVRLRYLPFALAGTVLAVVIGCVCVDHLRILLFQKLKLKQRLQRLDKLLESGSPTN